MRSTDNTRMNWGTWDNRPLPDCSLAVCSIIKLTVLLVEKIVSHSTNSVSGTRTFRRCLNNSITTKCSQREGWLCRELEELNLLPQNAKRAVDIASEKGTSSWLIAIPIKEMG